VSEPSPSHVRARSLEGPSAAHFRRRLALVVTFALCVAASGCTGTSPDSARQAASGPEGTIVVGVSGAFPENQIVAEMYAQVLEHAGYSVERQLDLRSREVSQYALETGQIDLKPEYLSSLLLFVDPNGVASNDPDDVFRKAREVLEPKGIEVLSPSPAQDTNQFVANAETAQRFGLTTMTSLAAVANQLTIGAPPECPQRPFCLTGLRDAYGIVFNDFKPLDVGGPQTVAALESNEVQIGLLFSTDPSIGANGFVSLVDDKHLQNAENLTPVIRSDALNDDVRRALDGVSARLSTDRVTALVGKVVIDGQDIADVASEFLTANGLLP
jgi:osmoprotectant transport system substrate-binding protein